MCLHNYTLHAYCAMWCGVVSHHPRRKDTQWTKTHNLWIDWFWYVRFPYGAQRNSSQKILHTRNLIHFSSVVVRRCRRLRHRFRSRQRILRTYFIITYSVYYSVDRSNSIQRTTHITFYANDVHLLSSFNIIVLKSNSITAHNGMKREVERRQKERKKWEKNELKQI